MAINAFVPEVWSASLLESLKKSLIYGSPAIINRDYEGEIANAGDTVRITSISRPTISTYNPNASTITPQQIIDAARSLVVDQAKSWSFLIDDVDARQAAGNVMPAATAEAAYGLADVIDQYIAGLYTGTASANVVTATSVTAATSSTWTNVYDNCLVPLKVALDKANVPMTQRYVVIPPDVHGFLLRDNRFIKVNESGSDNALRNGMAGNAAGFSVFMSNNVPQPSAGNFVVQAGVPQAITFAQQISKTEAYRSQNSFSDVVRGLALYGAKVIRPDCMATCTVTVS